jgi:hypothetical protein
MKFSAALTDYYAAGRNEFTAEGFHAASLPMRVASIP